MIIQSKNNKNVLQFYNKCRKSVYDVTSTMNIN